MRPSHLCLASLLILLASAARADGPGGTLADWQAHRAAVLREPGIVRLYTFEGTAPEFVNLAGGAAPLTYSTPPGQPEEPLSLVQGRWPGKQAVHLNRGVLSADPFEVGPEGFTVELWFRKSGPGALRGNAGATNGTLVSQGNGYWDGWRVTTSYPEQTFGFEIGRPQPSSSLGFFGAGPLADGAWHHLAATWDGKEMRLYLNGLLTASRPYDGAYTPPGPGDRFRIGYADAGWGSTKLEVDEVAVWGRTLSADEVFRHSLFYEVPVGASMQALDSRVAQLQAADEHARLGSPVTALRPGAGTPDLYALACLRHAAELRARGQSAPAARWLSRVASAPDVSERFRLSATIPLLDLARTGGDAVPVLALERLLAQQGLPPRDRRQVRLALARSLVAQGKAGPARAQLEALASDPSVSDADRRSLRLEAAHARYAAGDLAGAREAYGKLRDDAAAPPHFRSYAALLVADACVRQKGYAAAAQAYRAAEAMPGAPDSHKMEAEEGIREVARLRKGLPAHDPAASRVRLPAAPKPAVTLYVAPNGSDGGPGTLRRPLATFEGAAAAVRALKARGPLPRGGVAVVFRGGDYHVSRTVQLSAADSGAAAAPIVYRAYPGEQPRFTGGTRLRGFAPVTDTAVLSRLPAEARGKVVRLDLKAEGVTEPGQLAPHGMGFEPKPVTELFWNGRALPLARWPNEGWATTGKVVAEKTPSGGFTFAYDGDRPARWAGAKDAWLYGYWRWLWADTGVGLASVDPAARTLTTVQGAAYGIQAGMPWYAYNLMEELDAPGEWYMDRQSGTLYVYPRSDPASATVELSGLPAPFVAMDGVAHVRLERLAFELGRTDGIRMKGGTHCLVAGCTVRKLGGTAVTIDGGDHHGVFGCDLGMLGRGGVVVRGGDRRTLAPSGHFVENCHIHDFSRWDRTYTPAVQAEGVGIRIAHNLMHDSPGHAMRIEGNDHLIELNEVHHVVTETDDQGALDMWFNPSYRGVVIRGNFWHHVGDPAGSRMRAGIRLDDAISGVVITGNVFWKASEGYFGGVQIHGGKGNIVENNLFVDCKYGISFSRWGAERWAQFLKGPEVARATQEDVDIARPPYSTRYPALAHLAEDADVNSIWRNVAYGCGEFLTRDGGVESLMDNLVTTRDPGFANAAHGNFALRPGSWLAARPGFRPVPFGDIGRYAHPLAVQ